MYKSKTHFFLKNKKSKVERFVFIQYTSYTTNGWIDYINTIVQEMRKGVSGLFLI